MLAVMVTDLLWYTVSPPASIPNTIPFSFTVATLGSEVVQITLFKRSGSYSAGRMFLMSIYPVCPSSKARSVLKPISKLEKPPPSSNVKLSIGVPASTVLVVSSTTSSCVARA